MKISISKKIKNTCPQLHLATIQCEVTNCATSDELWAEMANECEVIFQKYAIEQINKIPTIAATRKAYKLLGKDPNRYRPSAEALCRRILRKIPIYRLSTLVDIINIVSIRSGYSIGGFDADKIDGDLILGAGTSDDKFEAIGRGILNIEGLPVYRDNLGGIGTPTSDHERTKITESTTNLLMIINGYSGEEGLKETVSFAMNLLEQYADLKSYQINYLDN